MLASWGQDIARRSLMDSFTSSAPSINGRRPDSGGSVDRKSCARRRTDDGHVLSTLQAVEVMFLRRFLLGEGDPK
jgi:hypothetical protein